MNEEIILNCKVVLLGETSVGKISIISLMLIIILEQQH